MSRSPTPATAATAAGIAAIIVALVCLLAPYGHAAAADVPANSKSILWEPYAVDEQTTGLFHFDGGKRTSVDSLLNGEESQHEPAAPAAAGSGPADQVAINAVPLGPALSLSGACSHAAGKGRFGDGPGPTEKTALARRRAQDPDGQFAWKAGVLTCPVRGHDLRIFELHPRQAQAPGNAK